MTDTPEQAALRAEVRELCARFPDAYWRELDAERALPRRVRPRPDRGRLAGGPDPGRVRRRRARDHRGRASSSRRSTAPAAHSAACHAQMYMMGTLAPARQRGPEAGATCREIAAGRAAPAGLLGHRARGRLGHHAHHHDGRARRRRLRHRRPQDLDEPDRAVRPAAAAGPHGTAPRRPGASGPAASACSSSTCARSAASSPTRSRSTPVRTMFNYAHQRASATDAHAVPGRQPRRRGGRGLPPRHRRLERRAHPARLRVRRRRLLVRRSRRRVRHASATSSTAPSAPTRACSSRSPGPGRRCSPPSLMRDQAAGLFDAGEPLRRGGQHGEARWPARRAGRPPTPASTPTAATASSTAYDVERKFRETRLYQVRAGQQQHGARLPRPARPRPAPLVLSGVSRA